MAEVPDEIFDAVVNVNSKGVWTAMRAGLRAMTTPGAGGGSIVNISSIGGTFGAPEQSVYGATKAAVIAMSRAAAAEYGREGVRVNAIAPGATVAYMMTAWEQRVPGSSNSSGHSPHSAASANPQGSPKLPRGS